MQKGLGEKLLGPPTHVSASVCVCASVCVWVCECVCTCVRAILNISNICNICRCRRHSSNRKYTTPYTHTHPTHTCIQRPTPVTPPAHPYPSPLSALWQPRNFGLAIYRTPKTSTAKVNAYFLVRQPPADVDGDDDGDSDVSVAQSPHVKMLPVSRVPATVYLSVGTGGYGWGGG